MIAARAFLFALLVCWAFPALADVAVPPLSGRVVDQTGTLSVSEMSALTERLKDLETRKGSQLAVLIVPTTAPETIEQYSIRVAEGWKIGRKKIDDGAILVVAKNDRKLRIEVGYGLEGALTDVTARRIIDENIVPKFRNGDFAGGISVGVEWIIAVIDGEKLPAPVSRLQNPNKQSNNKSSPGQLKVDPFGLIVLILAAATLCSLLGRIVGAVISGGIAATLAWYQLGSLEPSAAVGFVAFLFAWLAGDFVWGFVYPSFSEGSSSESESDSFEGGGGSFGGGGASGRW